MTIVLSGRIHPHLFRKFCFSESWRAKTRIMRCDIIKDHKNHSFSEISVLGCAISVGFVALGVTLGPASC
jgi:hypothetical protein